MTRKTGKSLLKARQQMRAARVAREKRDLAAAGVSLSFKKPPAKAMREKEAELKKLYLEMFPPESAPAEQSSEQPVAESIAEEPKPAEEPAGGEQKPKEKPREEANDSQTESG
jgi:hypothetical protein